MGWEGVGEAATAGEVSTTDFLDFFLKNNPFMVMFLL
jgi:hypothetical protein